MQNSSEKSLDERENSLEDSPMMTIDYLRSRLLSERLVSKAAKERADELAKRVEKLEEQLKIVSFQRKRAEKATLEVLSFLESHGVGDLSEVYESDSDQEESPSESNEGKCDATQEVENFGSLKTKGDNEASGSDCGSTTSSGRALSWKGRKEIAQFSDKKHSDFSVRRRASSAHLGSSQRHRTTGKSCRQIKRREMRSLVEKSGHDSAKSNAQDNRTVDSSENVVNSLDARTEELGRFPEKQVERFVQENEVSLSLLPQAQECRSRSPILKHQCNGEMERALEHQAQLIGRYEAEEKAQRDWEEKYEETNISTPDSCEPGNHSDVTEERDENKATVSLPIEVACHGHELKTETEANLPGKESSIRHFNSFKFAPHPDTGCSQTHIFTQAQASPSRSLAPDFSFSTENNNYQTYEHGVPPSFDSSPHCVSSYCESEIPENLNKHCELVPKEPQRLGAVLGALEEAKLLIKQQMKGSPVTSSRSLVKVIEDSSTQIKEAEWLKVPVGCPGLFRVPINLQSQAPIQSRLLGSDHTSELTNSSLYARFPLSQHEQYISSQMDTRIDVPRVGTFSGGLGIDSDPVVSNGQPRFDFVFNTITSHSSSSELASPSYPSFPDFFQGMSSKQTSFSPVPRDEARVPPSGSTLYYGNGVRADMYR